MLIIINNRVFMCVYKLTINFKVVIIYESYWLASYHTLHFFELPILVYLYEERLHGDQTGGIVVFSEK